MRSYIALIFPEDLVYKGTKSLVLKYLRYDSVMYSLPYFGNIAQYENKPFFSFKN